MHGLSPKGERYQRIRGRWGQGRQRALPAWNSNRLQTGNRRSGLIMTGNKAKGPRPPTLVVSRTALPPEGARLALGGPAAKPGRW
ncbi:MAG TPA: hypothetical protein DHV21_00905 [Curvibacter sp.]|nr:hypothetical protein [Curvibacter sp.]